ncbi:hypothetical protein EI42_01073 [Thermosporothrix hazakensis]|jgi:hypothetical protein|uniref:Uncharacterized protein n=1 Tax=Thermosporothrix hazakensis TaxID=644383 RepID=A0A326UAC7_THEHA|nr:hypothetical protein EI42_01073 [Thermosporothrix hazakensis]
MEIHNWRAMQLEMFDDLLHPPFDRAMDAIWFHLSCPNPIGQISCI